MPVEPHREWWNPAVPLTGPNHQELPTPRKHVVVGRDACAHVGIQKERVAPGHREPRPPRNARRHEPLGPPVEQLVPLPGPDRLGAPVDRDLELSPSRDGADVYLV